MNSNTLNKTKNEYWVPTNNKEENISFPDSHDSLFDIEEASFWFQHRNKCITKILKKYYPTGMFYDIGGGNGCVAKAIQDNGHSVTLIEPYEKGANNAVTRGIETVICSTIQNSGFPYNSIPAIGIFDVLEHIQDDDIFLKELNDYLEIGGKLFITVPSYQFLWADIDKESGHYRRYTRSDLKNKLKKANFEVLYQTYFFALLPIPIYFFRTLPSRFKIKKKGKENLNEHIHPMLKHILNLYSKIESSIMNITSLPFGGSCLVVARKK